MPSGKVLFSLKNKWYTHSFHLQYVCLTKSDKANVKFLHVRADFYIKKAL